MSILKYKYCPVCKEKTYHRYQSPLRSRFVACDGWECVNCQAALKKKQRPKQEDAAVHPV